MNEFTVKKLAEVQAFIQTGKTICEKGNSYAGTASQVVAIIEATDKVELAAAIPEDHKELFSAKVEKTNEKLQKMMDLYVGDEWDNPVEVLEWTSFFAGAGAAHAGLTKSATESSNPDISKSLGSLEQAYKDMLDEVIDNLQSFASSKS